MVGANQIPQDGGQQNRNSRLGREPELRSIQGCGAAARNFRDSPVPSHPHEFGESRSGSV